MRRLLLLLLALPLAACPPAIDDDDSVDDDDATDDDDGADDDDAVDDDDAADDDDATEACTDGWRPHASLPAPRASWYEAVAMDPVSNRLATLHGAAVDVWDLADPDAPALIASHDTLELGPWGEWGHLAHAPGGFVASGNTSIGPSIQHNVVLVEQGIGSSLLVANTVVPHDVQRVAAQGTTVVAAGAGQISFYEIGAGTLTLLATRSWNDEELAPNGLAIEAGRAVVTVWSPQVYVVPADVEADVLVVPTESHGQQPRWLGEGMLVPQSTNGWIGGMAGLSLIDPVAGTEGWLASVPWISAADGEDGAFEAVVQGGEILIANAESGVLRAPWVEPPLTIPTSTTLTAAIWPEAPFEPVWIEHIGDLLAVGNNSTVGLVELCE